MYQVGRVTEGSRHNTNTHGEAGDQIHPNALMAGGLGDIGSGIAPNNGGPRSSVGVMGPHTSSGGSALKFTSGMDANAAYAAALGAQNAGD